MTPVSLCLRKVDHASALDGATVVDQVNAALNELESAYRRPSERIVALEAVLQEYVRGKRIGGASFGRLLRVFVERRQHRWARRFR